MLIVIHEKNSRSTYISCCSGCRCRLPQNPITHSVPWFPQLFPVQYLSPKFHKRIHNFFCVIQVMNRKTNRQTVTDSTNCITKTRSTGTVYTSTKARLTGIETRIRIQICEPDRYQNLTISSRVHCQPSLKISCKSVWKFLRKVDNRRTNKQTTMITYPPWWR